MYKLKVLTIGDASGVVLPPEVLSRLRIEQGDERFLTETSGGFRITSHDEEFALQMEAAGAILHENHDALKRLGS